MSLINKMLQDLDARAGDAGRAPTAIYEDLTPANDPGADGTRHDRQTLLIVITLILTGAAIALGYLQREPGPGEEMAASPLPPAQAVPPPVVHTPPTPAAINQHAAPHIPAVSKQKTNQAATAMSASPAFTKENAVPPHKPAPRKAQTANHGAIQSTLKKKQQPSAVDKRRLPPPERTRTRPLKTLSAASQAEQHYLKGTAMLRQGRIAEGEDELRGALALAPRHHQARLAVAKLLIQQGRLEQSQETLRQGLALKPDHVPYARLLARLLVETGAIAQALLVLEDVRLAGTGDPEYLAFLAHLYQRSGRHQEAVENYRQALSLSPQRGKWWLGLGISYEAQGQREKALQAYLRTRLSTDTSLPLRQFAQRRIAVLQSTVNP